MEKMIRGKVVKMSENGKDTVEGSLVVKLTKSGSIDAEIVIDGNDVKWSLWIEREHGVKCLLADEGIQTLVDLADIINRISEMVKVLY